MKLDWLTIRQVPIYVLLVVRTECATQHLSLVELHCL